MSILHDLLLCDTISKEKKEDLQSHTVNLLTAMPPSSYEELLSPITEMGRPDNPDHEYDEMNMEVIAVLLKFLSKRLDNVIMSSGLNWFMIFDRFDSKLFRTVVSGWFRSCPA